MEKKSLQGWTGAQGLPRHADQDHHGTGSPGQCQTTHVSHAAEQVEDRKIKQVTYILGRWRLEDPWG